MRILNNIKKDACYGNCFRNYFCVPKMFIMPIKYLKILALIINKFSLTQMLVGEHVYSLLTNARPIVDCFYLLNCRCHTFHEIKSFKKVLEQRLMSHLTMLTLAIK